MQLHVAQAFALDLLPPASLGSLEHLISAVCSTCTQPLAVTDQLHVCVRFCNTWFATTVHKARAAPPSFFMRLDLAAAGLLLCLPLKAMRNLLLSPSVPPVPSGSGCSHLALKSKHGLEA